MIVETNLTKSDNSDLDKAPISVKDFVELLWEHFSANIKAQAKTDIDTLLHYGHLRGWLEDWDEHDSSRLMDKKAAARILHQFMKLELGIAEIADKETYSKAEVLRDLYLCRACANHIAHVYVYGIIEAEPIEANGEEAIIFNGSRTITRAEAKNYINKVFALKG